MHVCQPCKLLAVTLAMIVMAVVGETVAAWLNAISRVTNDCVNNIKCLPSHEVVIKSKTERDTSLCSCKI